MTQALLHSEAHDLDDRALIDRFKQTGEPAWFAPLFERHQRRIYRLCFAIVRNRAWAEDLVQDTFVRAYEEINRFDEQNSDSLFVAWLCTIGRNLCVSHQRAMKRRSEEEIDPERSPAKGSESGEAMLSLVEIEETLNSLGEEPRGLEALHLAW